MMPFRSYWKGFNDRRSRCYTTRLASSGDFQDCVGWQRAKARLEFSPAAGTFRG